MEHLERESSKQAATGWLARRCAISAPLGDHPNQIRSALSIRSEVSNRKATDLLSSAARSHAHRRSPSKSGSKRTGRGGGGACPFPTRPTPPLCTTRPRPSGRTRGAGSGGAFVGWDGLGCARAGVHIRPSISRALIWLRRRWRTRGPSGKLGRRRGRCNGVQARRGGPEGRRRRRRSARLLREMLKISRDRPSPKPRAPPRVMGPRWYAGSVSSPSRNAKRRGGRDASRAASERGVQSQRRGLEGAVPPSRLLDWRERMGGRGTPGRLVCAWGAVCLRPEGGPSAPMSAYSASIQFNGTVICWLHQMWTEVPARSCCVKLQGEGRPRGPCPLGLMGACPTHVRR